MTEAHVTKTQTPTSFLSAESCSCFCPDESCILQSCAVHFACRQLCGQPGAVSTLEPPSIELVVVRVGARSIELVVVCVGDAICPIPSQQSSSSD